MRLGILIAILALPILEIALLIKTANMIGFWATLGIVIATGAAGSYVIRGAGNSAFSRFSEISEALARGEAPVGPMMQHLLTLTAGALLLFPGLISDAAGAMLLIPPVRSVVTAWLSSQFSQNVSVEPGVRPQTQPKNPGPIIEGEYTRLDD